MRARVRTAAPLGRRAAALDLAWFARFCPSTGLLWLLSWFYLYFFASARARVAVGLDAQHNLSLLTAESSTVCFHIIGHLETMHD